MQENKNPNNIINVIFSLLIFSKIDLKTLCKEENFTSLKIFYFKQKKLFLERLT